MYRSRSYPNRYDSFCRTCRLPVPAGTGFFTKGSKWVHHAAGECPGPPIDDGTGFVYAITRMGPLCDLIKVGQTRTKRGTSPMWRPGVVIAQEHNAFRDGPAEKWRPGLLRMEPPRAWIAATPDRIAAEKEAHRLLSQYRPPNPIPPSGLKGSSRRRPRGRYGIKFGRYPTPDEFALYWRWRTGTEEQAREAAVSVCTSLEMFRVAQSVALAVLSDVTGSVPEEIRL